MDFLRFIKRRSSTSSGTSSKADSSLNETTQDDPNGDCQGHNNADQHSMQMMNVTSVNGHLILSADSPNQKQSKSFSFSKNNNTKQINKKSSISEIFARKLSKLSVKRNSKNRRRQLVTSAHRQDDEEQHAAEVIDAQHHHGHDGDDEDGDERGLITREDDAAGAGDNGTSKACTGYSAGSSSASKSSPTSAAAGSARKNQGNGNNNDKDGRYFIEVMDKEKLRIEVQVVRAEQDLSAGTVPEEVCGCLRAAAGKGRLLMDQKFLQFRRLCDKNLVTSGEGEEKVLLEDLAGFWDLVSIQVDEIHRTFDDIEVLRANGWRHPNENGTGEDDGQMAHEHNENESLLGISRSAAATARKTKSTDVTSARGKSAASNSKKRPSLPNALSTSTSSSASVSSSEKSKKIDEERRKKLAELKQKMKKQQQKVEAKKTSVTTDDGDEDDVSAALSDIVEFEGSAGEKQRLRA